MAVHPQGWNCVLTGDSVVTDVAYYLSFALNAALCVAACATLRTRIILNPDARLKDLASLRKRESWQVLLAFGTRVQSQELTPHTFGTLYKVKN